MNQIKGNILESTNKSWKFVNRHLNILLCDMYVVANGNK